MTEMKEAKKYVKTKMAVIIVGVVLLAMIISIVIAVWPEKPPKMNNTPTRVAEIPYISLHTFPNGIKQITIPIGPERWEGITVPLDTTAYRVDPTIWHQLKPWNDKPGPIVKKEEAVHRTTPIDINSDMKAATFWVRGEKEVTITIK